MGGFYGGSWHEEQPEEHHAEMCFRRRQVFGSEGYIRAREDVAIDIGREPTEAEVLRQMLINAEDYFCGF